jgi:hypothetical protein
MQFSLYPPSTASAYVCCSRRDTLVRTALSRITACHDIRSVRIQLRNAHSIPNVYRIPAKVAAPRGRRIVSPSAILGGLGKLIGGDPAEKTRKAYQGIVDQINALEAGLAALSDEKLRAKTEDFKARYKNGETLDDLLVEAFAVSPWHKFFFSNSALGPCYLREGKPQTRRKKSVEAQIPCEKKAVSGRRHIRKKVGKLKKRMTLLTTSVDVGFEEKNFLCLRRSFLFFFFFLGVGCFAVGEGASKQLYMGSLIPPNSCVTGKGMSRFYGRRHGGPQRWMPRMPNSLLDLPTKGGLEVCRSCGRRPAGSWGSDHLMCS